MSVTLQVSSLRGRKSQRFSVHIPISLFFQTHYQIKMCISNGMWSGFYIRNKALQSYRTEMSFGAAFPPILGLRVYMDTETQVCWTRVFRGMLPLAGCCLSSVLLSLLLHNDQFRKGGRKTPPQPQPHHICRSPSSFNSVEMLVPAGSAWMVKDWSLPGLTEPLWGKEPLAFCLRKLVDLRVFATEKGSRVPSSSGR